MPFNKGDFTQQGVNGHVNATVRLNEKRLVNIDMTSNEEAEGCTIAGTVTDLLNDKVYNIGSAPSGNIEITENTAEPLDISQYATATVNVSGGGSSTLTFKMIEAFSLSDPIPLNTPIDISEHIGIVVPANGGFSVTLNVNGNIASRHFTMNENDGLFYADGGGFIIDFNTGELQVTLDTAPTSLTFRDVTVTFTGGITSVSGNNSGLRIDNVKESLQHTNRYIYNIEPYTTAEIIIPAMSGMGIPK